MLDGIEAFRDASPGSTQQINPEAALVRAKKSLAIRFASWGGKEPPELHDITLATLMLSDGFHDVADLVRQRLQPTGSYEIESHVRLMKLLAQKARINGGEALKIVQATLDAQPDQQFSIDDRFWAAERSLARIAAVNSGIKE